MGPEMNITNSCIKYYLSFFYLAVLHLYQLNRSDMLNARKIQEFVMFISQLYIRYPREACCPLIYEYNITKVSLQSTIIYIEEH